MKRQGVAFSFDSTSSWLNWVGLAVAVGIAYFLTARLGLALRVQVGVAIFWPAAGVAVGALIALGPNARFSVAGAVAIATIVSSLMIGRSPWLAIAFGFVNAGQALVAAWLIERWFGVAFKLEDVPQVLGFLVSSAIGAALGATGAATTKSFVEPAAFLHVWRLWFAACLLGTVTVAPLLIGLSEAVRELPPRRELIEGAVGFVTLAVLCVFLISLPQEPWESALPVALVVPVVLWIAVRCRPVFAAAAAFAVALAIIWSTTFNIGHFGDASIPLAERIIAAQTHVLAGSLLALVLAALFADRRRSDTLLKGSNERLCAQKETFRRLLGSLPAAIYTTDKAGCITYCNQAAVDLWGTRPEPGKDKWSDLWRLHYPDGTSVPLDDRPTQIVLNEGRAVRGREALLERPDGTLVPIMPCPAPLIDERGTIVGVVNMQIDLTERKQAEVALAERDALLTLATKVARVGSYTLDCVTGIVRLSPGYEAIYGLPEGTAELSGADARACVHPDDLAALDARFGQAYVEQQCEHVAQFRIVRMSDGEVRWIETRSIISYDADRPSRIVGIGIDVTDRKQAEAVLKESEIRLADALAAGQVIAFEWDALTGQSRRSDNASHVLGNEQGGTTNSRRNDFFRRVHPDDREHFKTQIRKLCPENPSYAFRFRLCGPDGHQLWLEETARGEFDATGRLLRIKGLTRDTTERKRAEERQCALLAELDHRVKNVLATVSAVASHTLDSSNSMEQFVAALDGRIRSMASTHELLSRCQWRGVLLRELIRRELAPYAASDNTEISGPEVMLSAEAAQALAMVFHELATNAAKYGALSTRQGRVSVRWRCPRNGARDPLVIEWHETGGPSVKVPSKSGYGTIVVADLVPYELGGTTNFALTAEGVRCRLEIPARWFSTGRQPSGRETQGAIAEAPIAQPMIAR